MKRIGRLHFGHPENRGKSSTVPLTIRKRFGAEDENGVIEDIREVKTPPIRPARFTGSFFCRVASVAAEKARNFFGDLDPQEFLSSPDSTADFNVSITHMACASDIRVAKHRARLETSLHRSSCDA
jgi:hypothetical protein